MKIVCVLRTGGEYAPIHAQWLAKQVPGLICISDVPVEGVEVIPMRNRWPSWWCKMNILDPTLIKDDLLYLDLDTVVLGDLEQFNVGQTTMLSDFYRPKLPGSGFMFIKHEDKQAVWNEWLRDPQGHMARCTTREHWGDQGFLRDAMPHWRWSTDKIKSYKVHCQRGVPPGTAVICFHGHPRPWQVRKSWIPVLR